VAEWIEDAHSLERLCNLGIELGQGFYLHRPQPLDDLKTAPDAAK
jgi:EAL domain-containing protein (putative c-di-GMP-specific phosphodiesterase class I)